MIRNDSDKNMSNKDNDDNHKNNNKANMAIAASSRVDYPYFLWKSFERPTDRRTDPFIEMQRCT